MAGAGGDLDQVVAELGLNRTVDRADIAGEDDLVELRNHLTGTELAEIAAAGAGGAGGVLLRHLREVRTAFDLGLELIAGILRGDQDMTGSG